MGKQESQPNNLSLPIGKSSYLFSTEAQQYLVLDFSSKEGYESSNSVLIVQEPHDSLIGQFNLYKGLEIFFKDNPGLVSKTIFLAEGYPANQLVSVLPLIEQEPHPSDALIREVLGTFLITGYMAYEWKHQQNIPIMGIENKLFYQMSRDFEVILAKNPQEKFAKASFKDGTDFDLTFKHALTFSYVLRNKSMIKALDEQKKDYENPMLFVGGAHFKGLNDNEFNFIKSFAEGGTNSPFGPYASRIKLETQGLGLQQYLVEEKIGFTFLNPKGTTDTESSNSNVYHELFKFQQQGEWTRRSREEYRKYIKSLLAQRKSKSGVTTQPSTEAAAQYIKALKGGVIYETKPDTKKGGWFQISKDKVRAKLGKDTIWDKGIVPRGENYEKLREANLGSNCPVIDHFDAEKGTVTSLKTFDLRSEYYQDASRIEYTIGGYIEDLSEFWGTRWTAPGKTFKINITRGVHFQDRNLEIAIPAGSITRAQRQTLQELQKYAATVDVILNIVEVP